MLALGFGKQKGREFQKNNVVNHWVLKALFREVEKGNPYWRSENYKMAGFFEKLFQ